MYIGARFYSSEKNNAAFMKTAGKYLDIVSNNYYNKWTPDSTDMVNWETWTGKPFIITEYYTKGEDSGMPNQSGAGWIVRTQKDRGLFYQNHQERGTYFGSGFHLGEQPYHSRGLLLWVRYPY
jgi:hypothetical protein